MRIIAELRPRRRWVRTYLSLVYRMWALTALLVVGSCARFCFGDGGDFSGTCFNISSADAPYVLSAECRRMDGSLLRTTLNINECYAVSADPYNRTVYPAKG